MSDLSYQKIVRQACWFGCFCLVFVSSFFLSGLYSPTLGLDPSWQAVLEYAASHHFQFGRDIVFTYGPLGFLVSHISQGQLLVARVVFALLLSAAVALCAIGLARRMLGWGRYAFLGWIVVVPLSYGLDLLVFLMMMYGTVLLLGDDRKQRWQAPIFLLVLIVLSLIKFTFLTVAVGSLGIIMGIRVLQGKTREGVLLPAAACVGFVVGWLALSQGLTNLPRWIRQCVEISSGYNLAMNVVPQVNVLRAAVAALILFFATLALILRKVPLNLYRAGILVTVTLYVFVAWKEGFVRAGDHVFIFIWFLPLAFGFYCLRDVIGPLVPRWQMALTALYAGTMVLCLGAAHFQQQNSVTRQFSEWPRRMSNNLKSIDAIILGRASSLYAARRSPAVNREPILARAKAEIGNEPMDVMNYFQWAALANELNYCPRPVMQGYSAYTPYLQDLNEAHFRSPDRPRFVLLRQQTIDGRFPTLDDSAALNYVLNNYTPIARDHDFLVLRQTVGEDISFRLVHEQILRYGDKLDASQWAREPLFMSVSMQPSLLGRAMAFVFQPRPLTILLSRGTSQERYRFVPVMSERPFLLNPVLRSTSDVLNLYGPFPWKAVDTVTFERPHRGSMQFKDTFAVRLYTAPEFLRSARHMLDPRLLADLQGRAFWPDPLSVEGVASSYYVDFEGSPSLFVRAPGKVIVEIPEQATSFSGFFGILRGAYTRGGKTDGVEFVIDVQNRAGKTRRAFARLVQPLTRASDRGRLSFSIPIDSRRDRKVILSTGVGPKGNGNWDWSVWSDCRFGERRNQ
jgi:hypothetical protein